MEDQSTGVSDVPMRRLALAAVVTNVVIVVTGGAVRLTGSGLGCPEWPTCEAGRVLPTASAQVAAWHQAIEFGNRVLTSVVLVVAAATLVAAWRLLPRRNDIVRPAALLLAGVVAQGLVGGVTVLTGLNPLIVAGHFLVSIGLITAAVVLVRDAGWVELVPLGFTIILAHLGLLVWETRYVSASLAFPGLKPRQEKVA
jgi:cytochrome c oxidase assembly protein subunit 15